MTYIRSLPINDTPEMFGLHDNANITFAMNEGYQLLNNILLLQPKSSSGGGHSREEVGIVEGWGRVGLYGFREGGVVMMKVVDTDVEGVKGK